jgi:hypothetical protein
VPRAVGRGELMLVAYVSGHGFGHATRTAEVLRAVRRLEPALPISVVGSAPAELFDGVPGDGPLRLRSLACDVGLAQRDALVIDEPGTVARWREHARVFPDLVAGEARRLRAGRARIVLGDVPPLAFAAAAEAGIPGVAMANFSWDWVYRHLAPRAPDLAEAADACATSYARAHLLLRLPFHGGLEAFPRIEDVPLVARRAQVSRTDARRRLGLPAGRLALVSFGGVGLPGFELGALGGLHGYSFLVVAASGPAPDNVTRLPFEAVLKAGLRYEDLVGAADAVVTKPGYGIVSDAIAAGTPIVYTERGDFPEYPILVEGRLRHLPCAHVSGEDLRAGRLGAALDAVVGQPLPGETPDTSGALVVARRLLEIAG